jgi:hypothetical protein
VSRALLLAGSAALALSTVLLPWYELGSYEPNGWDATWLARLALAAALGSILLARVAPASRWALFLTLAALVLVAVRVAFPPNFGFGFDGLDVPVEREVGCWVALGAAMLAALGSIAAFGSGSAPGPANVQNARS